MLYPGVIATDLFDSPDDEPALADEVEPLAVDAVVTPVLDMLAEGRLEAWVPSFFEEIASGKAADTQAFLDGSTEWARAKGALAWEDGPAPPDPLPAQVSRSGCSRTIIS